MKRRMLFSVNKVFNSIFSKFDIINDKEDNLDRLQSKHFMYMYAMVL